MKKLQNILFNQGMGYLLGAVIVAIVINGLFTYLTLKELTANRKKVVFTYDVMRKADELLLITQDAYTEQRGFLLTQEVEYLEDFNKTSLRKDKVFEEVLDIGMDSKQKEMLFELQKLMNESFINLRDEISLTEKEDIEAVVSHLRSSKQDNKSLSQIRDLVKRFDYGELELLKQRNQVLADTNTKALWIIFTIAFFNIVIVLLAIRQIRLQQKGRKELFENLDKNNRQYLLDIGEVDVENEKEVVRNLISNLKESTYFIHEIGKENYEVELKNLAGHEDKAYNKKNLGGALVKMRDRLKKAADEDEKRAWITHGLAEFSENLRANLDSVDELGELILEKLIKYLNANQGAIFVLENEENEQDEKLKMIACYAYNRKKYLGKEIAPGEGLIGQAYLEQDKIFLTQLPDDYINISSGLGEGRPRCVLIMPLKVNRKVYGVLEIASFEVMEDYQIEFLEKLSESIASSLSSLKVNERTRKLLEDSQSKAEVLQAQEEEMRQNLEELSATQENHERIQTDFRNKEREFKNREQELLDQIEKLKKQTQE
jgi:CHASE3 domain sensor protein